jgi:hypothetical protein
MKNKTKTKENIVVRKDIIEIPVEDLTTTEIIDEFSNLSSDDMDERFLDLENELDKRYPFEYLYRGLEDIKLEIIDINNQLKKLLKHHHIDGKVLYEE